MKHEKKKNKEKIVFICFLAASICFYISAFVSIISKGGSNWDANMNICLGSAFFCLSLNHWNGGKDNKGK